MQVSFADETYDDEDLYIENEDGESSWIESDISWRSSWWRMVNQRNDPSSRNLLEDCSKSFGTTLLSRVSKCDASESYQQQHLRIKRKRNVVNITEVNSNHKMIMETQYPHKIYEKYSSTLPPNTYEVFIKPAEGKGLNLQLEVLRGGYVRVKHCYCRDAIGIIEEGDFLLCINGFDLHSLDMEEKVELLRRLETEKKVFVANMPQIYKYK